MKVSFIRRAALRAAVKGHVVKTRDLRATKYKVKSSEHPNREADLWALEEHRQAFRGEGRLLHLAYNFAKGTPYEKVEREPNVSDHLADRIATLVRCTKNPVREWLGLPIEKPKTARELAQAMGRAS